MSPESSSSLKRQTVSGMFWQFLQKISTQLVAFCVSVVLARRLDPEDFGVVALAGMFIVLLGIFSDGGLGPALVQKKDADERDFNTMFVTQLVFSSLMYVVIYLTAPFFAHLFEKEALVPIIRVMALTMPLGALAGVQNSVVTRRMMFRWYFYASLSSTFVSAAVGLYMAYNDYGAWALVGQSIAAIVTSTVVIFCLLDWHPRFQFTSERFFPLFKTGLKFMGTNLMGTFFAQLNGYALGLKYTAKDLAFYNRGVGIPELLCKNIDSTIQAVLFPALSKIQDDNIAVKRAIRRAIRTSTFVLFPLLFGVAAIADKLVIIVFSEKWASSIPFMQILSFVLAIGIMCTVNLQALRATGHIGTVLKLEFLKKPIMLVMILLTMQISPLAIAWGMLFFNIFVYFVNSYPNKKNIDYSYRDQILDVLPNTILAAAMVVIVYLIGRLDINIYLLISVQIIVGAAFYIGMSYLLKFESFNYVLETAKSYLKRRK